MSARDALGLDLQQRAEQVLIERHGAVLWVRVVQGICVLPCQPVARETGDKGKVASEALARATLTMAEPWRLRAFRQFNRVKWRGP